MTDFHAEILARRPKDWDGSAEAFASWEGYDVPTLIARDGVHPSHPVRYRDDYSEEALSACGFSLRNAMVLLEYDRVIRILDGKAASPDGLWPSWMTKAPTLEAPQGRVVEVEDVEELLRAARGARKGDTIRMKPGVYQLPRRLELSTDGVTLRGRTGRPEDVILDGKKSGLGELVAISRARGVTLADFTIRNARWNGFKIDSETGVHELVIRNCVIHNIWQRGIKGVKVPATGRESLRPRHCRVEYCLFYNDRPKRYSDDPADTPDSFRGNYIGGIDVMFAKDWIVRNNVFRGIRGRTGEARGAIFLWHEAEGCVVERNLIIDCDAGICLGNSHKPEDVSTHASRCIVRNNFVVGAAESGILADHTVESMILHNTIHDPESRLGRLIRLVHANEGLLVANNLLSGPGIRNESKSAITFRGNVARVITSWFVNPGQGDLHLTRPAAENLDRAQRLSEVIYDIDGTLRGGRPTVGAHELNPSRVGAAQ